MTQPTNVHARLRLTQQQPGTPQRDSEVEIWWLGSRFHVRDLAGRRFEAMEADLVAPRGLGDPARTMEDFMDRRSAAGRPPAPPTELFGDTATGDGWILRAGAAPRTQDAAELVVVAAQILAAGKDTGLAKAGELTLLGRAATAYDGTLAVTEDGAAFHTVVHRVIAPPYLLLEELHDKDVPGLSYRRELIALEEGGVRAADVTPPAR